MTSGALFLLPATAAVAIVSSTWRRGRWVKLFGALMGTAGLLASVALFALFPNPEAPPLSGRYPVGTRSFEIPAVSTSPALVVQAWYPSKADALAPFAPWLPDSTLAPRFPFQRIGSALSRARTGPGLADGLAKFPVIFYEHSWTGHRGENVAQAEELASHGFVVLAIDHPGQAGRVRYADGSVTVTALPTALDLSTEESVVGFEALAEKCLGERAAAVKRVASALKNGTPAFLAGRVAVGRLGVFGFSFGGTSALRLCAVDPAFAAGANEDGFFLGETPPEGPFLFFDEEMPGWILHPPSTAEGPAEALTRRSEARIQAAMKTAGRDRVVIDGTRHEAFSDKIFTCRIPRLARVGPRPADEVYRIVTGKLVDFFSREIPPP